MIEIILAVVLAIGAMRVAYILCYRDARKVNVRRNLCYRDAEKISARRNGSVTFYGGTENTFEEQVLRGIVAWYNRKYSDQITIACQYEIRGYRVDMMLLSSQGVPLVAIECDGATYHTGRERYMYDRNRERHIKKSLPSVAFYRVYSRRWWTDRKWEAKKLVYFLHKKVVEHKHNRCFAC